MEQENKQTTEQENEVTALGFAPEGVQTRRVYRKKSTFKGATEKDFWYSMTLSNGDSCILKFEKSLSVPDLSAFEIANVVGNEKTATVVDDDGNELYHNHTYYITACDFYKIRGEALPL